MKLAETSLFRGISEQECARMVQCFDAVEKEFRIGQVVYDFAEDRDCVGILTAGKAEVVRIDINGNRTILEALEAGGVFGRLFTFYSRAEDSVTAVCTERGRVVLIGQEHVTKRCQKACVCHSLLVENLLELVSAKAVYLSSRIEILSQRSIRDKLLCYFQYCRNLARSNTFTLPFSMSSLAEYISSDRSAMMREIKKMRGEGAVEIEKRQVTLKNI